jgi:hypothetical protein
MQAESAVLDRRAQVRSATPLEGDAVFRATAVFGLGAVAVIHFSQVVPSFADTPWLSVAFIALTLSCVGLAGMLLHKGGRLLWATAGVVNLLAVAGYVFTRLASTPFDRTDVGNWSETLGVTALFIEGILILLSLHAMAGRPAPRSAGARWQDGPSGP